MSIPNRDQLTTKEQFWYEHIQQVQGSNQRLSDYAEAHNLSLKCFYNYRSKLRKKGLLAPRKTKPFVKVTPQAKHDETTLVLGNGIRIYMQSDVLSLSELIKRLL